MTTNHTQQPVPDSTPQSEHDAVRSSNDRDQALEREGTVSEHNRGYDEAVSDDTPGDRDADANTDGSDLSDDTLERFTRDADTGRRRLADRAQSNPGTSPVLSGGDVDARWEDAESGGDETVGGSTATPGQNDLDDIGQALGMTYAPTEELSVGEKREHRDKHRWELDPASSEDFPDRTKNQQ